MPSTANTEVVSLFPVITTLLKTDPRALKPGIYLDIISERRTMSLNSPIVVYKVGNSFPNKTVIKLL